MTDHDEQRLRDRLAALDPASSLPPADPAAVARLLEDTMRQPLEHETHEAAWTAPADETRATGTQRRSRLTWLVAAAAVVIIAAVGGFALLGRGADDVGVPAAQDQPTVTELDAPAASSYGARCMMPTAERLATQSLAVDATVREVGDDTVTLVPTRFYAGEPTDLVRVEAPAPILGKLVGAVDFRKGGRYLVSAHDGQVTVCGFSAPWSADLAGLYARAFPQAGR